MTHQVYTPTLNTLGCVVRIILALSMGQNVSVESLLAEGSLSVSTVLHASYRDGFLVSHSARIAKLSVPQYSF